MSLIPSSIIKTYAETLGITNLSEEIITALAQDVEYRTREIIQEAAKFMNHSKRSKLSVEDVNFALQTKNVERLYGYDASEPLNFRQVPNSNIFFVPREEIDLETFIQQPLPKAPQPLTLTSHWLAIDGVQPAIPENPTIKDSLAGTTAEKDMNMPSSGPTPRKDLMEDVEVKPLVKHVLSKELQAYYDTIISDIMSSDGDKIKAALYSVATDSGLQQLLPYFIQFIAEMVPKNLRNLQQLQIFIGLLSSLLANEHIFIEPYLHQVMPPLLSCLLGKRLCEDPEKEDHWSLRDRCATITAELCRKFGHIYASLLPRVTKTMLKTILDVQKPLSSHYGAIVGISALGPHAIENLLLPHAEGYFKALTGRDTHNEEGNLATPQERSKCENALKSAISKWLKEVSDSIDEITVTKRDNFKALFGL